MIQSPDSDPIRQAKSGDLEAVRSCVAAAYGRYEEKIGKPAGPVLANYDLLISQERVHVLAIQDEIVGVLVLVPQSEFMLMDNVAVHPDSQGKGLGSILIAYAEQCAVRSGCSRIELYTNEIMSDNVRLYLSKGYHISERQTEDGYRRIYMRKTLRPQIDLI